MKNIPETKNYLSSPARSPSLARRSLCSLPLLICCLLLTSCIPVKLPAAGRLPAQTSTTSLPRAIFLTTRSAESGNSTDPILGAQYLFGIIPLTSIRFESSTDEFFGQILAEELQLRGYNVIFSSLDSSSVANRGEHAIPTLSYAVSNVALSAYDLIFFRRLSFQSTLTLFIKRPGERTERSVTITIDDDRIEKFGFLPTLSNFAAKAIRSKLEPLFQELYSSSRRTAHHGRDRESAPHS